MCHALLIHSRQYVLVCVNHTQWIHTVHCLFSLQIWTTDHNTEEGGTDMRCENKKTLSAILKLTFVFMFLKWAQLNSRVDTICSHSHLNSFNNLHKHRCAVKRWDQANPKSKDTGEFRFIWIENNLNFTVLSGSEDNVLYFKMEMSKKFPLMWVFL